MSHLKIEERLKLEHWLNEGRNFQEIADWLKKARSTIVREVRKRRLPSTKPGYNRIPNCCVNASRSTSVPVPGATGNAAHVRCATSTVLSFRRSTVRNWKRRRMFVTDAARRTSAR